MSCNTYNKWLPGSLLPILIGFILCIQSLQVKSQTFGERAIHIFDSLELDQAKDYKLIHEHADSLLNYFSQTNDPCRYIRTLVYQSSGQLHHGLYDDALHSLTLALSKYQVSSCSQSPVLPEIYLCYANMYITLEETNKALFYVNKGIQSWKPSFTDKKILSRLYISKGGLHEDLKEQLYYYKLAYQMAIESGNLKMQEYSLSLIGMAYAMVGNTQEAEHYLRQSLVLARNRNAYSTLPSIYNNLAGITTDKKLLAIYMDSSYYYAELSGDLEDQQISLQNMAYLDYNNGQFKHGYDLLWKSILITDSLFNQNKIKAFAEMEQKYESKKKATEILLLKNENEIATLQSGRRLAISLGLGGALLAIIVVAIIFFKQNKKKQKLNNELSAEKKKSDDLLLNILPEEVADELKQTGFSKARLYNNVTVLFTDFVNFTGISSQMNPTELVQEIHKNFTAFDAIIEQHGLEKIKTIGDAYLAVCGLPHELPDHALRVTRAAIDIRKFMMENGGKFQIRIGIHTGPVVAGIVGVKKYAYDIWGDTVNMANRMESNSEAGKINVSGATHELIETQFRCTYRGKIQAKNKGEVDMFFVDPL